MKATTSPRRLFRDSVILYAVLAGIVLVLGAVGGQGVLRTLVLALGSFVLATGYSWWRLKRRVAAEDSKS